jgi:membrane-bound ClpP family serine protease
MIRTFLLAATVVTTSPSTAKAGDFIVQGNRVSFIGPVESGDTNNLLDILDGMAGRGFTLEIETPGGLAVEGIMMLDALVAYPGLVTTKAVRSGAWSAGGMMWLGGDITVIPKDSVVGFHLAYVPGCNTCDTGPINAIIGGVMANAAVARGPERWYGMRNLLLDMAYARDQHGPQGFVMFGGNGVKDIGNWWDFYPEAAELLEEGNDHVGRTNTRPEVPAGPAAD